MSCEKCKPGCRKCEKRMQRWEQVHPQSAAIVRPVHNLAMRALDGVERIVLRAGGKKTPKA